MKLKDILEHAKDVPKGIRRTSGFDEYEVVELGELLFCAGVFENIPCEIKRGDIKYARSNGEAFQEVFFPDGSYVHFYVSKTADGYMRPCSHHDYTYKQRKQLVISLRKRFYDGKTDMEDYLTSSVYAYIDEEREKHIVIYGPDL